MRSVAVFWGSHFLTLKDWSQLSMFCFPKQCGQISYLHCKGLYKGYILFKRLADEIGGGPSIYHLHHFFFSFWYLKNGQIHLIYGICPYFNCTEKSAWPKLLHVKVLFIWFMGWYLITHVFNLGGPGINTWSPPPGSLQDH